MKQAIMLVTGRVKYPPRIDQPEGKKPYVSFIIELTRREYNCKTYAQRILCRSYFPPLEAQLARLQVGALVTVIGEADATVTFDAKDKPFANIRLTATSEVNVIPEQSIPA